MSEARWGPSALSAAPRTIRLHIRAIGGQSAAYRPRPAGPGTASAGSCVPAWHLREVAEDGGGQPVPGQDVQAVAKHDGGLSRRLSTSCCNWGLTRSARGLGLPVVVLVGELEQVAAFVAPRRSAPPARPGRSARRRPDGPVPARVVSRADHGELRHLLTAKPGNAPRVNPVPCRPTAAGSRSARRAFRKAPAPWDC